MHALDAADYCAICRAAHIMGSMSEHLQNACLVRISWWNLLQHAAIAFCFLAVLIIADICLNQYYEIRLLDDSRARSIVTQTSLAFTASVGIVLLAARYARRILIAPVASHWMWTSMSLGFAIYVAMLPIGLLIRALT